MDSVFDGVSLIDKSGGKVEPASLSSNKVVGLYFSAHWCPPCRGFTPVLAEAYKNIVKSSKPFQVVFVSSDRDQGSFDGYYRDMPWIALPFAERDLKSKLCDKYGVSGISCLVSGIPCLVLLNGATGELITKDGRVEITSDASLAKYLA
jgi:nucleoredoxin